MGQCEFWGRTIAPVESANPPQKLRQLKKMLDDGLISEAEYAAKKAEILADM